MQDGREVNALLGKGSEFEGKLTFEGAVRIDGTFSGEIFTEDTLIIGEGAQVSAQIDAGTVIIYGDVRGNVRTTELIELHAPARLRGDINTPNLAIDRGVIFEGSCTMTDEAAPKVASGGSKAPAAPAAPPEPSTAEPPVN